MHWSPFFVLMCKIGGYSILQLCACSQGTSFELLTVTIGPQASLLRYLDLAIESALWEWKMGQNRGRGHRILTQRKLSYFLGPKLPCKISSKSNKNCNRRSAERQTEDTSHFIICPMLCYSNGTDKKLLACTCVCMCRWLAHALRTVHCTVYTYITEALSGSVVHFAQISFVSCLSFDFLWAQCWVSKSITGTIWCVSGCLCLCAM